jgi:hypothetical protein
LLESLTVLFVIDVRALTVNVPATATPPPRANVALCVVVGELPEIELPVVLPLAV